MISALLFVFAFMSGQAGQAATTEELKKIEGQLAASWKQGDCDAWGASLDPQWSVIHVTGAIMTKVQVMELCKAPESRFETFDMDDLVVRPFGNAAVVTGRTLVKTRGATPQTVRLRFTDVFVRRSGRWLIVASQGTLLQP
jgi:Domain of unknown function (DUF4440)